MSSGFEFRGNKVFLTYPAVGTRDEAVALRDLICQYLKDLRWLAGIAGVEKHKTSDLWHVHVYTERSDRAQYRAADKFDVGGKHPNIKPVGSAKADRDNHIKYCRKEDQDPVVWGDLAEAPEGQKESKRLKAAEALAAGASVKTALEICPTLAFTPHQVYGAQCAYTDLKLAERDRDSFVKEVVWIHGPSGVGKTRAGLAYKRDLLGPGVQILTTPSTQPGVPGRVWLDQSWTGAEKKATLENVTRYTLGIHQLLVMTDRYFCRLECKGGMRAWAPDVVIFTSIEHPGVLFPEVWTATPSNPLGTGELSRRITNLVHICDHKEGQQCTHFNQDLNEY